MYCSVQVRHVRNSCWLLMIIRSDLLVKIWPYLTSIPLHFALRILARRLRWTLGSVSSWPLTVTRYNPLKGMANGRSASQHNTKLKHTALHTSTAPDASRHKIRYDVMTVSFVNTRYSSSPRHRHLPRTYRRNKTPCPLVDVHTHIRGESKASANVGAFAETLCLPHG